MTRKEIQQQLYRELQATSGTGDIIEVVGNIGISYNKRYPYLCILESDTNGNIITCFFEGEQVTEQFGNILDNSDRTRWNKIRKYMKEVLD